jgi:16S rRNA A1518/A1519 N6-dimethyltransferase RsmA/KsgA/DIM1 with predicted DNA glycosylase/AP lyase activity
VTHSLAFRKNEAAIIRGEVPEKYRRIVPFITGHRILEIGSAEGVLALMLARQGKHVTALEKSEERHEAAQQLYGEWLGREKKFTAPVFVNDRIGNRLDLLNGVDTLVAVRVIYYLGEDLDRIFAKAAQKVKKVVLCGNRNRAERWRAGTPDEPLGDFNRYAAREGMTELLKRHGYRIYDEATDGDEIVVGKRG